MRQLRSFRKDLDKKLGRLILPETLTTLLRQCVSYVAKCQNILLTRQSKPLLWEKYWLTLPGVTVYRVQTPLSNASDHPGRGYFAALQWQRAPRDEVFAQAVQEQMRWA